MSDFAQRFLRLNAHADNHELHDLTNERVMHIYYQLLLWTYAVAILAGNYQ